MKFERIKPPDPPDSLDYTRIGAAFEGFGWDGVTTLPSCITGSTDMDWTQYYHTTMPVAGSSYAISGMNFLEHGKDNAFDCAREIIQALAE